MPQSMTVTAPNGKSLTITGDRVPTEAELHDIFRKAGVDTAAAPAPTAATPLERGASEFYNKSPLKAVVDTATGAANVWDHPLDTYFGLRPVADTVKGMARAQWDQAVQAAQKAKAAIGGDPLSAVEALGHGMAAVLPVLGPAAADVGEHFAAGDTAGGVGGALALLTPFAAKYGIDAVKAKSAIPTRARVADANAGQADLLTREANQQVSQRVLAPGNPKFKGIAAKIAPEVLDRGLKGDRLQLQQLADDGMDKAGAAIDAAVQAKAGPIPTQPIVQALTDRIQDHHVSGSVIPTATGRVAALTQLRDYIAQLGPAIPFDEIRKIRDEFYDAADKAKGYMQTGGNEQLADIGWAAREAGGAIRQTIANEIPELKGPNAEYTFFKRLSDVLDPNIGRPKQTNYVPTGVTGGMATAGAIIGENALAHLPGGAALGAWIVPKLKALTNSPAWDLASAQKKIALAEALRKGDLKGVKGLMMNISVMAPRGVPGWVEAPAASSTADNRRR